jgi:hypothetical protein
VAGLRRWSRCRCCRCCCCCRCCRCRWGWLFAARCCCRRGGR